MKISYPFEEISKLAEFTRINKIKVTLSELQSPHSSGTWIGVDWKSDAFTLWVHDEYQDLQRSQPLLSVLLVLREFELLDDATDYLHWLQLQGCNDAELRLLDYYKNIVDTHQYLLDRLEIEEFDSFVSDLDFQLNAGAAHYLRTMAK